MNTPDSTLTNGRYELPASARGVLVLADPPEAGWRLRPPLDRRDSGHRRNSPRWGSPRSGRCWWPL